MNHKVTLYIDAANNKKTIVKLGDKTIIKLYQNPRSQDLLSVIDELLTREHFTLQRISNIQVNLGPGHFTSLRVSVAVANALGFALNIPVNNHKPGTPVKPRYGQSPNISKPKISG